MNQQSQTIVRESAGTVRAMARQTLKGRWTEALLVSLAAYAISTLPQAILPYLSHSSFTLSAVNIYTLMVSGPMALGISFYFLNLFRQKPAGLEDLLQGFHYMWRSFAMLLLMGLRIFLFSLLLVIPGIVAAIRYSQAFFIMADDPGKPARQCLWESSMLMRGNKSRFFFLELSFIGWGLLAALPPVLGEMLWDKSLNWMSLPSTMDWSQIAALSLEAAAQPIHPLIYLLGIGSVLLGVYMSASQACFYDLANGNLQVRRVEEIGKDSDE